MIIRRLRRQGKEKQPTPSLFLFSKSPNCPQVFGLGKRQGLCLRLPFLRNLRISAYRLLQHRNLSGVIEIVLNDAVQRDINRRHAFKNRLIKV